MTDAELNVLAAEEAQRCVKRMHGIDDQGMRLVMVKSSILHALEDAGVARQAKALRNLQETCNSAGESLNALASELDATRKNAECLLAQQKLLNIHLATRCAGLVELLSKRAEKQPYQPMAAYQAYREMRERVESEPKRHCKTCGQTSGGWEGDVCSNCGLQTS